MGMGRRRPARRWMLVVAVAAVTGVGAAQAQEDPASTEAKHVLYQRYCGACHGPNGGGDGVVAQYMTPRPTDLSQIFKKHDNTFPFQGTMNILVAAKSTERHKTGIWKIRANR